MNSAGPDLKYRYSRRFHFPEGLARHLIQRTSTGSSMPEASSAGAALLDYHKRSLGITLILDPQNNLKRGDMQ